MRIRFIALFSLFGLLGFAGAALAGDCYSDPIHERDWHGKYDIAAFVRDNPCMEGTEILETMPQGTVVEVIAETDGWYKVVTTSGIEGWTGAVLMSITSEPLSASTPVPEPEPDPEPELYSPPSSNLIDRVRGYILLQVEQLGEAWFVNPADDKRYYMKDGDVAYEMMRSFGLGITDADLADVPAVESTEIMNQSSSVCSTNSLASRLSGQILLQVEQHGEAWYVYPDTCRRIYLADGDEAYEIMRYLGLGITDNDLDGVVAGDLEDVMVGSSNSETETVSELAISSYQRGDVPSGVDLLEVNEYWLDEINDLRASAGVRELVLDQRFIDSATEWAGYTGEEVGYSTHTRPDGSSMHEWVGGLGYEWTERYSDGGWVTNYFSENISWNYANGTTASVEGMMDETIDWMLAEGSGGVHYRSIYHADWNAVGTGLYFEDRGSNYKLYLVIHYGSLEI